MITNSGTEVRSHKKLDPEIKALRAISRALDELADDTQRERVMEWMIARGLGKSWISLSRLRALDALLAEVEQLRGIATELMDMLDGAGMSALARKYRKAVRG